MSAAMLPGACIGLAGIGAASVYMGMQTLEPTEYGLEYDWWAETVTDNNGMAYTAGRYWLGVTKTFITFPSMVETVQWSDDRTNHVSAGATKPPIWSRTSDGLAVELECSLQYQVMPTNVTKLYKTLGTFDDAKYYMMQVAKSIIMTEATHYSAEQFFKARATIAPEIEAVLREAFKSKLFAYLQFFQLQQIILPAEFEESIRLTQQTNQQISMVQAVRGQRAIQWETDLLKMKQHVAVRTNQARSQAAEIDLDGKAKGQRIILQAEGNSAAIRVSGGARANASLIQRKADSQAVMATTHTEAATVRLQSLTAFNSANLSSYLKACAYGEIMKSVGSEERFLELMKVHALQNVSFKSMTVNVAKQSDPLAFMGLA